MTPRLRARWTAPIGTPDVHRARAWFERVPERLRDRIILPWNGPATRALCEVARAARTAGFRRVRVERVGSAPGSNRELAALVRSGVNEVACDARSAPGAEVLAALRARTWLEQVVLVRNEPHEAESPIPPLGADEMEVRVDPTLLLADPESVVRQVDALLAHSASRFRRVSVRGLALCRLPSLDPDRVVSNALEVRLPDEEVILPFEDPQRVFFRACRTCHLALACDGFGFEEFRRAKGPCAPVRPFGEGTAEEVTLDTMGLLRRVHPPSFWSGRVHLLSVAAGIRPAGRVAVRRVDLDAQLALIEHAGLVAECVEDPPCDTDRARTGEVHVFFARDLETARTVAGIERRFVLAERGPSGMGAASFAWQMGRALGYPECCIEAFVEAGPDATTWEMLGRAHPRSRAFSWLLNVLDPRSSFPLIPHVPCRFDCGPSIALASAVANRLDSVFPGLRGAARRLLARPTLMWPPSFTVAFVGRVLSSGCVEYQALDIIGSAEEAGFPNEMWEALVLGREVRPTRHGLEITDGQGQTRVFRADFPPILFPFED